MRGSRTGEFESFLARRAPLATPAAFRDGETFGEWRITAFLGKGGGGEVYCAERIDGSVRAALKLQVSREGASSLRFEREVAVLSANRYPFFPRFFGAGEDRGCRYYAMELLEPVELPRTDAAVAEFLIEVCGAVRALHRHGLVHRDIKPQNIMRRANGELVLIDLGLVKELSGGPGRAASSLTIADGRPVGAGTPRYAAPEQFNGGEVTPATDIHALGMLANECFLGRPPRAWQRIVVESTSSVPGRRYADVDDFCRAVRRRHRGRRVRVALVALAAIVSVAMAARAWYLGGGADTLAWRALCEPVVTNIVERQLVYEKPATNDFGKVVVAKRVLREVPKEVRGTLVRLRGERHEFAEPLRLEPGRHYWIVGPGSLVADIECEGKAFLHLDRCELTNRSLKPVGEAGVVYVFAKGVRINFANLAPDPRWRSAMEDYDCAYNQVKFRE